jgi:phosphoribosylglycinamide formyltransferase-1
MVSLLTAIRHKRLAAEVAIVLSNNPDALILDNAGVYGVKSQFIDPQGLTREAYDQAVSSVLEIHDVDLIVLIGYSRTLSADFMKAWQNRIIKVHPSLLPAFADGTDREVYQAVLDAKSKESGCTVYYVTEEAKAEDILAQKKCLVLLTDNVDRLKARVQQLEAEALIEVLNTIKLPAPIAQTMPSIGVTAKVDAALKEKH